MLTATRYQFKHGEKIYIQDLSKANVFMNKSERVAEEQLS